MHLILPHPISINKAYAGYPKRHKSNDYVKWEREARNALKTQEKYTIEGDEWLQAMYILYTPLYFKNGNKKKIDVANYEKIVSDFLTHEVDGFRDENIISITLIKKEVDEKGERMEIFIDKCQ